MFEGLVAVGDKLRSIFHDETALLLTLALFLVSLGIFGAFVVSYIAFQYTLRFFGIKSRFVASIDDIHRLEEAQAARHIDMLTRLPCSDTCSCKSFPKYRLPSDTVALRHRQSTSLDITLTIIPSDSIDSMDRSRSDTSHIWDSPANSSTTTLVSPNHTPSKLLYSPAQSNGFATPPARDSPTMRVNSMLSSPAPSFARLRPSRQLPWMDAPDISNLSWNALRREGSDRLSPRTPPQLHH